MIYGKVEPTDIYEVKALIYVQKTQMDKYRLELTTPSATTNIAQSEPNNFPAINAGGSDIYQ